MDDPLPDLDRARLSALVAAARVRLDADERPRLWRRLYADGMWLAVFDTEPIDAGLQLRSLTVPRDAQAFLLGASTEADLAAVLGDLVGRARLVHIPGHHLAAIWPCDHHLVLDAGTPHAVVLPRAEVAGLPSGPSVGDAVMARVVDRAPRPGSSGSLAVPAGTALGRRVLGAGNAGFAGRRRRQR